MNWFQALIGHAKTRWERIPTPTWDRLRTIGASRFVKLTVVMPLIGYLILFNHHVVGALELATQYFSPSIEESLLGNASAGLLSSRLRLLYFGLFMTGTASALFGLFCPPKIKQYPDAVALTERELPFLPITYFLSLLDDLSHRRNPASSDMDLDDYRDNLSTKGGPDLERLKVQILSEWYWSQNHRYPTVRWFTFIFFLSGFALLIYPSAITIISVFRSMF